MTLPELLKQCRELEAKASKGPWVLEQEKDWDDTTIVTSIKQGQLPGSVCSNQRYYPAQVSESNQEFIAFSRNNFLKLVECVEVLSDACELTKLHYAHTAKDQNWAYYLYEKHNEALKKVEEILK